MQCIDGRRFLCTSRRCGRTVIVLPRGVAYRCHYGAGAIGLALFLYGVLALSARQVRERIGPFRAVGYSAPQKWLTLNRWIDAASDGGLFHSIRASPRAFRRGRRRRGWR